jgi:hypothetical protein
LVGIFREVLMPLGTTMDESPLSNSKGGQGSSGSA